MWKTNATDTRGRLLKDWLDVLGLFVMNTDGVATCVRPQGRSVIDLCIGNAQAQNRIQRIEVSVDTVTVSDHRLIIIDLIASEAVNRFHKINTLFPRWNYKKLNGFRHADLMNAAAIFWSWLAEVDRERDATLNADWFTQALKDISDMAMPRSKGFRRVSTYWWSEELAVLRSLVIKKRRAWSRVRKGRDQEVAANKYAEYRITLREYRLSIKQAKNRAWKELLDNIDGDPWGIPYKLVLNKLRPVTHPISETLPREFVRCIVDTLFPVDNEEENRIVDPDPFFVWQEDYAVSRAEVRSAMAKFRGDKKAPDGIVEGIVSGSSGPFMDAWANCFTGCLREGVFPDL